MTRVDAARLLKEGMSLERALFPHRRSWTGEQWRERAESLQGSIQSASDPGEIGRLQGRLLAVCRYGYARFA